MQEERLVNLAVLSVEREISRNLNLEDEFAADDKNHKITLSYNYSTLVAMYLTMLTASGCK